MEYMVYKDNNSIFLRGIRYLALISIINRIINIDNSMEYTELAVFLVVVLFLNDYLRIKNISKGLGKLYYVSYMVSIVIMGYFTYKFNSFGTGAYNVYFLIEAICTNKKANIPLVIINFISYLVSTSLFYSSIGAKIKDDDILSYIFSLSMVIVYASLKLQKGKSDELNKQLGEAYLKEKNLLNQVKELTIEKERTRIAQELHDSIGHSLIALKMNLEFAENMVDVKPEKAKEVINRAEELSKDCIITLREVVSLLKQDSTIINLRDSINEIFRNFKETNTIKFILEMDDEIENNNPEIKNCIYKTIREAITNGVKHGDATKFEIEIIKDENEIKLNIKNNGVECKNIVKSNGVKGIEDRIIALGGNINFKSDIGSGFTVESNIPNTF